MVNVLLSVYHEVMWCFCYCVMLFSKNKFVLCYLSNVYCTRYRKGITPKHLLKTFTMLPFIIVLSVFIALAGLFAATLRKSNVDQSNFHSLHR